MGLHTGIAQTQDNFPSGMQPEIAVYAQRAAVCPIADNLSYMNTLVIELKKAGVWQKLDALYIFNQDDFGSIPYNIVQTRFDPTFPQGSAGFVPGSGVQGDGTSIWANTNCNLATQAQKYKRSDASMFILTLTDVDDPGYVISAGTPSTSEAGIRTGVNTNARIYPNSESYGTVPASSSAGLIAWSRNGSNAVIGYRDGALYDLDIIEYYTPYANVCLLRNSTTGSIYSNSLLSMAGFGAGLTSSDLGYLYNAVLNYLISCGTIFEEFPPAPSPILPGCFTPYTMDQVREINGPDFRVFQATPPPTSNSVDQNTYPYFPLSDAQSYQVDSFQSNVTTETTIDCQHWIWQFRYVTQDTHLNQRPNILYPGTVGTKTNVYIYKGTPSYRCALQYTTLETANAATECLIRFTLGYPAHTGSTDPLLMGYLDVANAAGIPDSSVVTWQYAYANASTFFTDYVVWRGNPSWCCVDKIILTDSRLVDAPMGTGIVLDCEAQDGRTPEQLLAQLTSISSVCEYKNKKFILWTNPLNQWGAIATGFSASNLYQICNLPNINVPITVYNGSLSPSIDASFVAQINLLKGPNGSYPVNWPVTYVTCGMRTGQFALTVDDANVIRSYLANGMLGVGIWRYYGQPGGPITTQYNQALAAILGLPLS